VSSAARTALQSILHASFGSVAEMRAYWNKFKGTKLEERWYAMLKDDSAGMGRWLEAAGNITQPENIRTFPGTGFSEEHPAPSNAPARLRGEVLRGAANPSVAELMHRRATEIPTENPAGYDISAACEMGLKLVVWDPATAVPVAKLLTDRLRATLEYSDGRNDWSRQRLGAYMAKMTTIRLEANDPAAAVDYAAWLKTATPDQLGSHLMESLEPLARFATNAILGSTAQELFSNTNSAWGRLPWKDNAMHNPIESSLVRSPAFRQLLLRELERKEVCGSVKWRGNGIEYTISNHVSGSRGGAWTGTNSPAVGFTSELRWCDWIAWSLASSKQIPAFDLFAPGAVRDEAIIDAKAILSNEIKSDSGNGSP
jgi:hypothetical protein